MFKSLVGVSYKNLAEHGVVIVGLSNMCDAFQLEQFLKNIQPTWTTRRLSPKQYARQAFNNPTDNVSDFQAQLIVTVFYDGNVLAGPAIRTLKLAFEDFGYLKAIHSLPANQQRVREFRVEYEDTRSTNCALSSLKNAMIDVRVVHSFSTLQSNIA